MSFLMEKLMVLGAVGISLTVHEYFHGWVAYRLGDKTAKAQGRLTLNPIKHIDPIGLILLMVANFGWAKPVPIDPRNFKKVDIQTGMLLTAVAGPLSNLILCFLGVLVLVGVPLSTWNQHSQLWLFLNIFILLNANLAFFNLLPIPPLDGSKILFGIVPKKHLSVLFQLERYSGVLLILLIVSGGVRYILQPLSQGIISAYLDLAGYIFKL